MSDEKVTDEDFKLVMKAFYFARDCLITKHSAKASGDVLDLKEIAQVYPNRGVLFEGLSVIQPWLTFYWNNSAQIENHEVKYK